MPAAASIFSPETQVQTNVLYSYNTFIADSASYTAPVDQYDIVKVLLTQQMTTINLADYTPANGLTKQAVVILGQGDGGAKQVTWGNNIKWAYGRAPILSFTADSEDILVFLRDPGSDSWYGFTGGGAYYD